MTAVDVEARRLWEECDEEDRLEPVIMPADPELREIMITGHWLENSESSHVSEVESLVPELEENSDVASDWVDDLAEMEEVENLLEVEVLDIAFPPENLILDIDCKYIIYRLYNMGI